MADNGKLQFFGQIVYPQTLSTNILNPDGTPAPVLPIPSPANVGKVPVVNAAGNGYDLQAQSSGGITLSQVIAREETLPTATADSPDFVEVGGVLYRKKVVEGGSLLGTWSFNNTITQPVEDFNVSFIFGDKSCNLIETFRGDLNFRNTSIVGADYLVYSFSLNTWYAGSPATIQITDISALTNEAEFTSWLTANATKQGGGGGTVTYSYVALADA